MASSNSVEIMNTCCGVVSCEPFVADTKVKSAWEFQRNTGTLSHGAPPSRASHAKPVALGVEMPLEVLAVNFSCTACTILFVVCEHVRTL